MPKHTYVFQKLLLCLAWIAYWQRNSSKFHTNMILYDFDFVCKWINILLFELIWFPFCCNFLSWIHSLCQNLAVCYATTTLVNRKITNICSTHYGSFVAGPRTFLKIFTGPRCEKVGNHWSKTRHKKWKIIVLVMFKIQQLPDQVGQFFGRFDKGKPKFCFK